MSNEAICQSAEESEPPIELAHPATFDGAWRAVDESAPTARCPKCNVEITPENAGGYRTYCDKCVEGIDFQSEALLIAADHAAKSAPTAEPELKPIYVASRASIPERGAMWRKFRDIHNVAITSSWIDEDGEGDTRDFSELWRRIADEISHSNGLVLYAESDDFPLKGAFIEAEIALGMGKRVVVCLPGVNLEERSARPIGSWIAHPLVMRQDNINAAVYMAQVPLVTRTTVAQDEVTAVLKELGERLSALPRKDLIGDYRHDPDGLRVGDCASGEYLDRDDVLAAAREFTEKEKSTCRSGSRQ